MLFLTDNYDFSGSVADTGGIERCHIPQDVICCIDQVERQSGPGAFSDTHIQLQQRIFSQSFKKIAMACFRGTVPCDQVILHTGNQSISQCCRCGRDQTIHYHRSYRQCPIRRPCTECPSDLSGPDLLPLIPAQ